MSQFLFRLTAIATMAFVMTILAMIAMLVGDPMAPVNLWFNRNGGTTLLFEVVVIVLIGMAAMAADRRETLREQKKPATAPSDVPDHPM